VPHEDAMNGDAIFRVTQAMQARLKQALVVSGDPGTVFVGPLDDPDAQGASLILFLYRIVPCANLRNNEHRVVAPGAPPAAIVYRNAFPLDLYYLVTIGTRPGTSEETLLRTLGYAIRELHVDPQLVGATVGHETIHVSFEPLTTDEASRIWQLFPTANYRTSVSYLATPVWIDPPLPPTGAPVVRDTLRAAVVQDQENA
jgi:hypothetical protein